jgi:hypothetical protein
MAQAKAHAPTRMYVFSFFRYTGQPITKQVLDIFWWGNTNSHMNNTPHIFARGH